MFILPLVYREPHDLHAAIAAPGGLRANRFRLAASANWTILGRTGLFLTRLFLTGFFSGLGARAVAALPRPVNTL